jgi:hypothetical protein
LVSIDGMGEKWVEPESLEEKRNSTSVKNSLPSKILKHGKTQKFQNQKIQISNIQKKSTKKFHYSKETLLHWKLTSL